MYLYRDEAERLTAEMREGLGTALRNISDQLLEFLTDNDWAMVIKLHAAIEATITQVILAHTNQEVLRPIIERLPLSDNQTGKGRIAVELELITKSQFTFLRKFSELRNSLVHRVENIGFNIVEYFERMDGAQKNLGEMRLLGRKAVPNMKYCQICWIQIQKLRFFFQFSQ